MSSAPTNDWLTLSQIAEISGGILQGEDRAIDSVATDSRLVKANQLFIAIKGERFDAHDFVADLVGVAGAVLVCKKMDVNIPQVIVKDTLKALANIASAWRAQFTKPVVGLTGSNGKTTLKEMIAAILSQKGRVLATHGNLNNDIGMPLTLLRLRDEHDFAVIEMGANHFNEIEFLTHIARPDIAVVNNAGAAHLEGFGDVAGVAQAKGEIFTGLGTDGIAVINADDPFADYWLGSNTHRKVMMFGIENKSDITGRLLSDGGLVIKTAIDEREVKLKLLGRHNALNALAATAVTTALGIQLEVIVKGLESLQPVKGRLAPVAGIHDVQILDDTYNANPESAMAALDVLSLRKSTAFVLGDMAELGEGAQQHHKNIGEYARQIGIDRMYCVGEYSAEACDSFGDNGKHFSDMDALLESVKQEILLQKGNEEITNNMTILVKGSRSMRMERVVDALCVTQGENV